MPRNGAVSKTYPIWGMRVVSRCGFLLSLLGGRTMTRKVHFGLSTSRCNQFICAVGSLVSLGWASPSNAGPVLWGVLSQANTNTANVTGNQARECFGNAFGPCDGLGSTSATSSSSATEGLLFASATAIADLSTGEMKLATDGTPGRYDVDTLNANTQAAGILTDTLYFAGFGSAPMEVSVRFRVEGTFDASSAAQVNFQLLSGAGDATLKGSYNCVGHHGGGTTCTGAGSTADPDQFHYNPFTDVRNSANASWDIIGPDVFVATIPILASDPWLYINQSLSIGGLFADFSNTSTIELILPEGVTFTSASGVFLSDAPVSAIPESATWAMMIAGFGLVGGAMRRRGDAGLGATA